MRFNNIQVLRLFAAVGVVLYHLGVHGPRLIGVGNDWLLFPVIAGFPVPLFFAVSGFVLTHAIQNATPGRFLLARFLRLYPGYWLAVLGTLALMRLHVYTEHHRWLIYFVMPEGVFLWPAGPERIVYFLGIEWSLIYEVFLSVALTGLSLFGPRRGLPILTVVWIAVLLVKMIAWPGAYYDPLPHWSTIALSAFSVPFVLGVLAYQVKDADRRWIGLVFPAVLGVLYWTSTHAMKPEPTWLCWGLAGAGAVWLATRLPQLADRNPLVRLGDCTYGLFLFHVPLLFAVLHPAARLGWQGRVEVLWLAGATAIVGGLLFGSLEASVHTRLRPIAKWNGFSRSTIVRIPRRIAAAVRDRLNRSGSRS